MKTLIEKLHARLGDFWWYSLLLFAALRVGDVINAVVGLWLVPKYVGQEQLGAVLPLTQFAASVGAPMSILVYVFSKMLVQYQTKGEHGKVKSMLIWSLSIAVGIVILTSIVTILILPHYFERLRVDSGSLTALIILSGLLGSVAPVFNSALQGLKKFNTITFVNLISAPVRLITMLVAMPFRALSGYMLGQSAAPFVSIVAACIALRKHLAKSVEAVSFWREDGRLIARYASMVSVTTLVGAICTPIMAMIVRQRLPEFESAAYYMLSRFAELSTYAGQTMLVVIFPFIAESQEKGKNPIKYLVHSSLGMTAFGFVVTLAFAVGGEWLFNLIPTCRPFVGLMPELVIMSVYMITCVLWSNLTAYETARGRFRYYFIYGGPITILQTVFLVCFTGYTFFNGILPPAIIEWMSSLKIATLRNFLWTQLAFNVLRLAFGATDIYLQNRACKSQL